MIARSVHRFVAALAFAALPLLASGQPADKIARIGYLGYGAGPNEADLGFVQGLRELGCVEGRNLVIESRWAAGRNERFPELAADLVRAKVDLREPGEIDGLFIALPAGTNGLLIENSAVNYLARDRICALAAQRRLPAASNDLRFAHGGCLLSYGEDIADINRRKAGYVDRILKGAQPADLPVEQPTKFDLVINLKTAKELGLTIPWSLLMRAEEVIE